MYFSILKGIQIRVEFLKSEDIYSFIRCAQEIELQEANQVKGKKIKWFVSSDESWVVEKIKNEISNSSNKTTEKVFGFKGKIGHVLFDEKAYERAILDVELLGRCDRLVLTGGSTFGFVAAFKSGRRPYFVDGWRQMKKCALFDFSAPSRRPTGEAVFK